MVKYLLLLHGYTQNGNVFKKKITKLLSFSFLEKYTVISPDGCYKIDDNSDRFGWWELKCCDMYTRPHKYINFKNSVEYIQKILPKFNDDDTLSIMAFSQGSVLAEYMLINNLFTIIPYKVIFFSPSGIMDEQYVKPKIRTESGLLVVIGDKEDFFGVTVKNYMKTSGISNYRIYSHDKGHVVPSKSRDKQTFRRFLL